MSLLNSAAWERARYHMIEQQVRPWNVSEPALLQALAQVKREDFTVAQQRAHALMDVELPLTEGEIMLAPKVQARLIQALLGDGYSLVDRRVLLVGAGSGYMVALLASMGAHVFAQERHLSLIEHAKAATERSLSAPLVQSVTWVHATDAPLHMGPFDAAIFAGSLSAFPKFLAPALRPNGRVVAIVGQEQDPVMRAQIGVRSSAEQWQIDDVFDTHAPALHGFTSEKPAFSF